MILELKPKRSTRDLFQDNGVFPFEQDSVPCHVAAACTKGFKNITSHKWN